jgi:hypothetical protein
MPSRWPGPASSSSVAQVGGSAVIAVTQQDNNLWFYWQAIGAAPWNPELVGPGGA